MQKLGWKFYIPLFALTLGVLGMLAAWLFTHREVYLYIMLGIFPLYLFHLIFGLAMNGRAEKRLKETRSAFLLLAGSDKTKLVYLTYLGDARGIAKPSPRKRDYLVEFYAEGVDRALLKRHLWFGLSEREEDALRPYCLGGDKVPYPLLGDIRGQEVLVQEAFLEAAKDSPAFGDFLRENRFETYGNE